MSARRLVFSMLLFVPGCQLLKGDWSSARESFEKEYLRVFRDKKDGWGKFDFDEPLTQRLAGCVADSSVRLLNASPCSPFDSERGSEKCLAQIGFEARVEAVTVRCLAKHLPDDWKFMRSMSREAFVESQPAGTAPGWVDCAVDGSLAVLNASTCRPVNRAATKAEDVVVRMDSCLDDDALSARFQQAGSDCTRQHMR